MPEPSAHTQEMYAILDTVVQAVLTDQNADIDALLTDADARSRRSSTPTDRLLRAAGVRPQRARRHVPVRGRAHDGTAPTDVEQREEHPGDRTPSEPAAEPAVARAARLADPPAGLGSARLPRCRCS